MRPGNFQSQKPRCMSQSVNQIDLFDFITTLIQAPLLTPQTPHQSQLSPLRISFSKLLLIIFFKRGMLKGLKTSKNADLQHNNTTKIKENDIKESQVMKEQSQEQDINVKIQNRRQSDEKKSYKECFGMFLEGKSEDLMVKLQELKKKELEKNVVVEVAQVKKGKFDYNFNYDDDTQKIKKQIKKRNRPIMASNRTQDYCIYCPDNQDLQLLSASNYVYLSLAKYKTLQQFFHFILAPVDHQQTNIGLNEDIITEINNYKKCLIQAFDQFDLQVIFFQQFFQKNSHIYIECLAIPRKKAEDLPFFFKQALEDIEGNWTTHKSIIKIEKQKGGIQKQIPKQINYFYIDFSNGYGYAHVIQNQKFWKREFCYEVIATSLNIEIHRVKTTQTFSEQQIKKKRQNFQKIWKKYDWTQLI